MSSEGFNKARHQTNDIPDVDGVMSSTSHRFSIRGETAALKVTIR